MTCTFDPHDHLLCRPATAKEKRSVKLARRLRPEWSDDTALEFVRIFAWHIARAPGGVEGLLR